MFDFQQKRKIKSWLGSRVTQGVLFFLALMVLMSAFNRYLIAADMADRRAVVEAEVRDLEARRSTLEAEVKYLNDERGIEAEMRRQFDIAREGEQVVIILDEEKKAEVVSTTTATTTEGRPWYRFW
jgi:cell division protein FtsB